MHELVTLYVIYIYMHTWTYTYLKNISKTLDISWTKTTPVLILP